jgi:hypothetical protein
MATEQKRQFDLSSVYITNGYPGTQVEGAVLRCMDHPQWEIDVDGTLLPVATERAVDHVRMEHGREVES